MSRNEVKTGAASKQNRKEKTFNKRLLALKSRLAAEESLYQGQKVPEKPPRLTVLIE